MIPIHQFEKPFCDKLVSSVHIYKCYSIKVCRDEIEYEELHQSNDSLRFEVDYNSDEILKIKNIIETEIGNVKEIKNIIEIADLTTKYIPTKFRNSYVFMTLLNDDFIGGRMSIDNKLFTYKAGDMVKIYPNQSFNLEKIIDGKRYCLVSYVDVEYKKNKTIL